MAGEQERPARLEGRNGEIWRRYVRGETMESLGEAYGICHQRVSQIIKEVRDSIPQETRDELIRREVDLWEGIRAEILREIYGAEPVPVTAGRDGDVLRDPETQEIVRDHGGRLAGATMALRISESLRRMLGVDAAHRVDVNVGEEAATQEAAAQAFGRLMGPDAPEGQGGS